MAIFGNPRPPRPFSPPRNDFGRLITGTITAKPLQTLIATAVAIPAMAEMAFGEHLST